MGGELGAGPGAAGGCGPASLPPPRDYLVPAAAMSPGRNVPPQIMLFISLGGSTARQHQAPGGRCARSPALPSSPCAAAAAAAAAPGLGLAAAPAPTQVSPGRARQLEGVGCGCGCGCGSGSGSGCARLGRAARAQRRRWAQGALDARGSGDRAGAQPWVPGLGAARGPRGPDGCGSELPGARESAWASGGAWRAGRLLWRSRSWSVAGGHWEGGEGGCTLWSLAASPRTPAWGQREFCP